MLKKFVFPLVGITMFIVLTILYVKQNSPAKYPGCRPQATRDYIDPSQTVSIWRGKDISPLQARHIAISQDSRQILGVQSQDKVIDISLSQKKLIAKQNQEIILETPINIGQYAKTPSGEFSVIQKHMSVDITGGSNLNSTYYYLSNTPYALYFSPDFALLGSYWTTDFGTQSGFGCIEVPLDQAEKLYYWADSPTSSTSPGTKIVIHP